MGNPFNDKYKFQLNFHCIHETHTHARIKTHVNFECLLGKPLSFDSLQQQPVLSNTLRSFSLHYLSLALNSHGLVYRIHIYRMYRIKSGEYACICNVNSLQYPKHIESVDVLAGCVLKWNRRKCFRIQGKYRRLNRPCECMECQYLRADTCSERATQRIIL